MTLTKKALKKLEELMCITFTSKQKSVILERFGTEPDESHEWSEQDITEQIRKILSA